MVGARRVRRDAVNRASFLLVLLALTAWAEEPEELVVWKVGETQDDRPVAVGSLQKPFVARAWSRSHPGQQPPRFRCEGGSTCWLPSGHGTSGMTRALSLSCNAYFRRLAREVPADVLEATFLDNAFLVVGPLSPDGAFGLPTPGASVSIRPSALLNAYVRLLRTPWAEGEGVRQAVLAGLRDAAWSGTASGLARRGLWAKTGTTPALDGRPLTTSGWVVAGDDSGWACLALLPHGTGREAAVALDASLAVLRPSSTASRAPPTATRESPVVRVGLFETLRPRRVVARNVGPSPAGSSRGWVGPGRALSLLPGDRLEAGLWELAMPETGLTRRVRGALRCREEQGRLRLVAELSPIEYVSGVLLAELPEAGSDLRVALGAAVLRFLSAGPRHAHADVCDTTHCAWFVGRGPRVGWPRPRRFVLLAARSGDAREVLDPATWTRIVSSSGQGGPNLWTRHCGGHPLSAHFVWGNGDQRVFPCARHGTTSPPWTRLLRRDDLHRALGAGSEELSLVEEQGVWGLRAGSRVLRYDEAHRLLADVLGWDALPSPASRLRPVADGYEVEGVGSGHRVGLCLAD